MNIPILGKFGQLISPKVLGNLLNLWPPFLGAGIRIQKASPDLRYIKVELRKSWYNNNYVGVQFGGSIYAMVDPFYMMMLMHQLGEEYRVWDQAAKITFLKPGKTALSAEFHIEQELLDQIYAATAGGDKFLIDLPVEIFDKSGTLVARVVKTLYIRKKGEKSPRPTDGN